MQVSDSEDEQESLQESQESEDDFTDMSQEELLLNFNSAMGSKGNTKVDAYNQLPHSIS